MQTFLNFIRNPKNRLWLIYICLLSIVSIWIRFYQLGAIHDKIFDEVYFPVFANNYLTHTSFFDAHPPLGKLIIAVSIWLFGNVPFGWRCFNALAGLAVLAISYGFTFDLTKSRRISTIAFTLFAIEPMILVESRVGLINIYLLLFSLLGLWFFWRWYTKPSNKTTNFIIAMLAFGAASSVKWIGLGVLGSSTAFYLIDTLRQHKLRWQPKWLWLFVLLIPAVYFVSFIPDLLGGQNIWWWHQNAYEYQANLTATHPYGSDWWTWPFVIRPIWLYFQMPTPQSVVGIIELGNVITWTAGVAALIYSLLSFKLKKPEQSRTLFLAISYLAVYLPWALISRVKFIYHYLVPVSILLIILAIALEELGWTMKQKWLAILILLLGAAFFVYFIPLLIGYQIPQTFYLNHMWFKSWI